EVERFLPGKGGAPLGPVTSLALTWDDPSRKAEAVRSADADVTVTVGPDEVTTEARLRLRGAAVQWRFTAPATADVTVGPWVGAGRLGRARPSPPRPPLGRGRLEAPVRGVARAVAGGGGSGPGRGPGWLPADRRGAARDRRGLRRRPRRRAGPATVPHPADRPP